MTVTRRAVLEELAAASGAEPPETTSVDALAAALEAEPSAIEARLDELVARELALRTPDGAPRVTLTGEQLLELDLTAGVIIDIPER